MSLNNGPVQVIEVDLKAYPTEAQRVHLAEGEEATKGDAHGNASNVTHCAAQYNIITLRNDSNPKETPEVIYAKFRKLYKKNVEAITEQDLKDFDVFLSCIKPQDKRLLRLIGDEISDRGENDYFTLKIMQRMKDEGVPVEVIYSNHANNYFYEKYAPNGKGATALPVNNQRRSLTNMRRLIERFPQLQKEVDDIVTNTYLPSLKLIGYSVSPDQKDLTLYTHAAVPLNYLESVANTFGIPYQDNTIAELTDTIDKINAKFQEIIKDEKQYAVYHNAILDFADERTQLGEPFRPRQHHDYNLHYVHGHVGLGEDISPHIHNLDGDLGKSDGGETTEGNNKIYRAINTPLPKKEAKAESEALQTLKLLVATYEGEVSQARIREKYSALQAEEKQAFQVFAKNIAIQLYMREGFQTAPAQKNIAIDKKYYNQQKAEIIEKLRKNNQEKLDEVLTSLYNHAINEPRVTQDTNLVGGDAGTVAKNLAQEVITGVERELEVKIHEQFSINLQLVRTVFQIRKAQCQLDAAQKKAEGNNKKALFLADACGIDLNQEVLVYLSNCAKNATNGDDLSLLAEYAAPTSKLKDAEGFQAFNQVLVNRYHEILAAAKGVEALEGIVKFGENHPEIANKERAPVPTSALLTKEVIQAQVAAASSFDDLITLANNPNVKLMTQENHPISAQTLIAYLERFKTDNINELLSVLAEPMQIKKNYGLNNKIIALANDKLKTLNKEELINAFDDLDNSDHLKANKILMNFVYHGYAQIEFLQSILRETKLDKIINAIYAAQPGLKNKGLFSDIAMRRANKLSEVTWNNLIGLCVKQKHFEALLPLADYLNNSMARGQLERELEAKLKAGPAPKPSVPVAPAAKAEAEANAKAEREAREQAEREAKEKAEKEAREQAEREAKEQAEREAKEQAEREAKERAEQEAKAKAEREAKAKAEREAKEKAEREAKEKAAQEARAKAAQEARAKAAQDAKAAKEMLEAADKRKAEEAAIAAAREAELAKAARAKQYHWGRYAIKGIIATAITLVAAKLIIGAAFGALAAATVGSVVAGVVVGREVYKQRTYNRLLEKDVLSIPTESESKGYDEGVASNSVLNYFKHATSKHAWLHPDRYLQGLRQAELNQEGDKNSSKYKN